MTASVAQLHERIAACLLGALAGEAAAGTPAGAADLLGVAESASACSGFDEADLRHRGLERPSRSGTSGLLLRALPFGLLHPLTRPRLRREAYRSTALAGADEATAIAGVAVALLAADLLRFDLATSLVRVRQSLLEDAPMALLQRISVERDGAPDTGEDPAAALQQAITALDRAESIQDAVREAGGSQPVAMTLAGALAGARGAEPSREGIDPAHLPHAERALHIAQRLADCAASSLPAPAEGGAGSG